MSVSLPSMNRRKEVVDDEVNYIVTKALSGSEVKAEMDSGKHSARGRLLGCAEKLRNERVVPGSTSEVTVKSKWSW